MFPVKGLSISAEKLKNESEPNVGGIASKPARKRKRPGQVRHENVTADNLSELWDKVIEHKAPGGSQQPNKQKTDKESSNPSEHVAKNNGNTDKKDKKKNKDKKGSLEKQGSKKAEEASEDDFGVFSDEDEKPAPKKAKKEGGKKQPESDTTKTKDNKPKDNNSKDASQTKSAKEESTPVATAPAAAKLTPLQASMREKLISARFRHLNETLYTRPSKEAFSLFEDSPEMFTEYHEGFRRQVDVWPENPVDIYIADIKARAKLRIPPRARQDPLPPSQLALPRNYDTKLCTVVDLGCGDAKLATTLEPLKRKLKLDIFSYDLQTGGNPLVMKSDIANLPVPNDSVDVVILCLALMGTNWLDFIEEAYRILKWRGELWVAEIKSRFTNPALLAGKGKKVVDHSVGNRKKGGAASKQAELEEESELTELAVQVDGAESLRKNETDISAFLEALRKRGFLLNRDMGEHAVDMSNKMFVRMHFSKVAPALKGKCAAPERNSGGRGNRGSNHNNGRMLSRAKFIGGNDNEENDKVNEKAILKPCVYKIR
ncbi:ribosomal RNA-processing protein 8 [Podospora fimiseda]|uniref:Ribosomal RNA-processing protein 8 n=1 Tax=Podospora fimiseda TaxID=252190 RepID=A0AAN7H7V9_9PEZI|nr:ribosomal RNA-processing protein 8 [Podospora fimiseda]